MDWISARHEQAATGPAELIGREPEIQQLRLFVSRITQGAGEALLLLGDPGVGKTSLLDQAAAIAAGSGIRLLRATGSQFEADISFAALHQLLHPCLAEVPHLSPLHARAMNVALGLGEGPPPAQLLVASAVLALLQQASKEQPLLLIVDDLPWLDRASAVVLGMVARRLAGLPVALLAACRTGEPSFFDQGNLPVTRVEPLSEEAAARLLASRYPVMTARVRRRLLDAALGNPLALLELPVSLGDLARSVAGSLPAELPLGRRLQTAFASRVQALPTPVYELLLLAVLDGKGDLRLLRVLAADRGGEGLGPAERAGLVHADESTEQLTFRHPLIRSAIVELSTSEQRRRAHAELAARLADQPERHAWHLAEATEEPDERVAALLQEVAHANLRRGDSVGAVTELLRAAELSPSGKGRSGRLAEAAYLGSIVTSDLRDAPRLLEQARRAHPGPGGPLSAAVAGAYHLLHGDGDVDTAHRLLTTAIYELDDPRDAHNKVLIEALYTLIMICFFGGRADLWPPLQNAVDRLIPRPPELLAILSKTFSDPARLTPAMLARADASVADLGQQVSPARIIRTGIAVAYLDRLSQCREPLQRAIQHGREGGAVTSAIEALFLHPAPSPPTPRTPCGCSSTSSKPPSTPAAAVRPRPTPPPPATAASTGSPHGCAWSSSPARPSPNPGPTPPPSNGQSPNRATTAGPSTWPASSSPTAPTCAASSAPPTPAASWSPPRKPSAGSAQPPGRPARTVNYAPPGSPSPPPTPAWPPSPPSNARSPCSPRQATPTKRSPPASSSPRERSPPTSTRSSPSSASPRAPPSATHSPTRLENETVHIAGSIPR